MQHESLTKRILERLLFELGGRTAAVFNAMRSCPDMIRIATSAKQPHLRAGAVTCLCKGVVAWPLGTVKSVWIDKSMGVFSKAPDRGRCRLMSTYGSS
jgi:hypothetical protein